MVEVSDMAQRLSAEIIVVANILVASESLFSRKPGGDFVIYDYYNNILLYMIIMMLVYYS